MNYECRKKKAFPCQRHKNIFNNNNNKTRKFPNLGIKIHSWVQETYRKPNEQDKKINSMTYCCERLLVCSQ